MEVDEIQNHEGGKLLRSSEGGEVKRRSKGGPGGGGGGVGFDFGRICGWPSSRIVRVSRASGGKDRHSKVLTSRGLRDRRVRLSVNTAIQLYDLQDRLGFDQPSKALEWLLNAASRSIAELPFINPPFPDINEQHQLSDEKRSSGGTEAGLGSGNVEPEAGFDPTYQLQHHQQQQQENEALSKSASSSTSESSKGSGRLSLTRSETRVKARDRARGRVAEKDKQKETEAVTHHNNQFGQKLSSIAQNAVSFTELLSSGIETSTHMHNNDDNNSNNHSVPRHWSSTPMGYFSTQILGPSACRPVYSGQLNFGEHYQESQPFSAVQDHFSPLVTIASEANRINNMNSSDNNAYELNFNRGTLQSNCPTPSLLPHIQRFPSVDGSLPAFFIGAVPPLQPNTTAENIQHHHFLPLCYGDLRHSDHSGKGKI